MEIFDKNNITTSVLYLYKTLLINSLNFSNQSLINKTYK